MLFPMLINFINYLKIIFKKFIMNTDNSNCDEKNILSSTKLNNIKDIIESFEKEQQIQVLQILKVKNININENKNGVFINLTNLDHDVIKELENFIEHLKTQENILLKNEKLKNNYIETYFKDNKSVKADKDSVLDNVSNGEI